VDLAEQLQKLSAYIDVLKHSRDAAEDDSRQLHQMGYTVSQVRFMHTCEGFTSLLCFGQEVQQSDAVESSS